MEPLRRACDFSPPKTNRFCNIQIFISRIMFADPIIQIIFSSLEVFYFRWCVYFLLKRIYCDKFCIIIQQFFEHAGKRVIQKIESKKGTKIVSFKWKIRNFRFFKNSAEKIKWVCIRTFGAKICNFWNICIFLFLYCENTKEFLNDQMTVKTLFVNNELVKNEVNNSALNTKEGKNNIWRT